MSSVTTASTPPTNKHTSIAASLPLSFRLPQFIDRSPAHITTSILACLFISLALVQRGRRRKGCIQVVFVHRSNQSLILTTTQRFMNLRKTLSLRSSHNHHNHNHSKLAAHGENEHEQLHCFMAWMPAKRRSKRLSPRGSNVGHCSKHRLPHLFV